MSSACSNCAIWYWPHRLKKKGVGGGITVKMQVSGPWIAIKHANKRPLCPKPLLHVMKHDWTYDRRNLSTLPNIHAEQTFFHKPPAGGCPPLYVCMYVLLDVLWLSMLYQVGVNWEVTGWIFLSFHSFRPDLMQARPFDLHPLSLRGSSFCFRGRFGGLGLENKTQLVSRSWSCALHIRMIKWAPGRQRGSVRDADALHMSDMWMWWYGECGYRRMIIYTGTQHEGKMFRLTSRYQYLTSSSHIISTVSTSLSSDHGLFNVVHCWNRNPNQ